jgi:hypothetical protein
VASLDVFVSTLCFSACIVSIYFFLYFIAGLLISLIYWLLILVLSWDSAVNITTGYRLDGQGVGVQVPVGARISLLHIVQTGCGAHSTSYPKGTRGSFPGDKVTGV